MRIRAVRTKRLPAVLLAGLLTPALVLPATAQTPLPPYPQAQPGQMAPAPPAMPTAPAGASQLPPGSIFGGNNATPPPPQVPGAASPAGAPPYPAAGLPPGIAPVAPPPPGAPMATDSGAATSATALDYLYNRRPADGSAGAQAAEYSRVMEAKTKAAEALGLGRQLDPEVEKRFEKYLGMPEATPADLRGHALAMGQVAAFLREGKTFEAWKALLQVSNFEIIDAGVGRELANRVESVWNIGRASQSTYQRNKELEDQVRRANRNADLMSGGIRQREIDDYRRESQGRPAGSSSSQPQQSQPQPGAPNPAAGAPGAAPAAPALTPPPSISGLEGRLQLTDEYLRSLESRARIKINDARLQLLLENAKQDFVAYVETLFQSSRHLHVIIAADFYRKIFYESEYPVGMANQVTASLETQRAVASGIDVFRYKLGRGEIAGATAQLRDAFAASEFHFAVLGLERTQKEKVARFVATVNRMRNSIEARDFANLETMLTEARTLASDFDPVKPMALVNAVKLESKLRLGKAKLFAQKGDINGAMQEFQLAAESWPGNPDLQDKALAFFDAQDLQSQSLAEFDRLVSEGNLRQIFEKQLVFASALRDDVSRQEKLKEALTKVKSAEIAAEKASTLLMGGDPFGAWESIEFAAKDLADDRKLNKLRADLAGRGAEFIAAVNKARDAEAKSDLGYSLTWYVNAQRHYPASRIANEGIERLSRRILSGDKAL